jgi:hypothetical protein
MSIWYKEHDHDAYVYKYANSWVILEDNNGKRYQAYVNEIRPDNTWRVRYFKGDGSLQSISLDDYHPIYYYVGSRYYPTDKADIYALIKKKLTKSFCVGVGNKNYSTSFVGKGAKMLGVGVMPLLLEEPKFNVKQSLEEGGLIGDRFLITKEDVFYLDTTIGMRKKNNFLVNKGFKSEIEDCLRGHECLIIV